MSTAVPLRSLPRLFVAGASMDGPIVLPSEEVDKLRKVLRLGSGAKIAVLPGDGTLIEATFDGRGANPEALHRPDTEPQIRLTIAQALPKGDKIDEIVRACTEIGVARFIFFPSERTIVRWDEKKTADRVRRLAAIAREAAEVSFRTHLPVLETAPDLAAVLRAEPEAIVLSEVEGLPRSLNPPAEAPTLVIGPEGGWSNRELELIGDRGVTLGPRVLRVDHAGPAAAAIVLLEHHVRG